MPKKTIIIFITTFILVGIIILGFYFWFNKSPSTSTTGETPWYQNFNPFGTGGKITTEPTLSPGEVVDPTTGEIIPSIPKVSKFYQITDFAVAGASFLEDSRPIKVDSNTVVNPEPEQIKTLISPDTKEGRMEIQKILNDKLSLKPILVVDGSFGKKATEAIKAFQKLNNLTITGKIDTETAPYFIKISQTITKPEVNPFEKVPSIRYVERVNGHIYKMFLDTKNKEKISNTTIPNIYEAFFDSTGNSVVYRYISSNKTISSFMATLGTNKGEFLIENISDFSISKNKNKFFYIVKNNEGSIGTISLFGDNKKDNVFNSPFTEWLSDWDINQNIFLTTKPSYAVEGSMFILNPTNKTTLKILGGILGLTTKISPSGNIVLYSEYTNKGPVLKVFDISKHTSKELDTYGLSEKCVWSNDSTNIYCAAPNEIIGTQYPDVWYQGLISFNDFFIKINTLTGDKSVIANSVKETEVDGTNLFLDKTESNLFFINKKDSTLWSLTLK
jgi:hypothetical protein